MTRVDGAPGSERRVIVQGRSPSWGGGSGRAFSKLAVARRQRGARVRGRITVARGSTVALRLTSGGAVGRKRHADAPGGRLRFTVALSAAGRRQLDRRGRLRVVVRVAVTAPGGEPERARRVVTLRG